MGEHVHQIGLNGSTTNAEAKMGMLTAELPVAPTGKPILTVLRPETRPTAPKLGFVAALDLLGQSVAVYTLNGALLHRTAAFRAALELAGVSPLVRAAVASIAKQRDTALRHHAVPSPVAYRDGDRVVRASLYQPSDDPMVLVCIEATSAVAPSQLTDEQLMERFGLTPAEVRVARHLASGEPNKVIATTLGVSAHTTRHHTERVFRKLGIQSRAAVVSKLTSLQTR
jgi:DNA-binding CsgD family transcriptional regulator